MRQGVSDAKEVFSSSQNGSLSLYIGALTLRNVPSTLMTVLSWTRRFVPLFCL